MQREQRQRQASQVALVVKNLPANTGDIRDAGSIPGSGRFPWRRIQLPRSSGGGRAATHPQGVPNTVQSSHRRRQVPLSVSCPFIGPERSPNLKNRPQLALTLPFKRLLKRHFFVKVASLKFLCEKKAQRSGESRKRKVPGLPPHKRSLARAQIEDFLVRYSRSTNLVSEQRRLSC